MKSAKVGSIQITAIFSEDKKTHRYVLRREFKSDSRELKGKIVFVMLNPTFGDELLVDKSNRLACNISIDRGFSELSIVNLYSIVTPNSDYPLYSLSKNNFDINDKYIQNEIEEAKEIVIAWGITDDHKTRKKKLEEILVKVNKESSVRISAIEYDNQQPYHLGRKISDNNYNIVPYIFKYIKT